MKEIDSTKLFGRLWHDQLRFHKGRIFLIFLLTALTSALTALYPIVIEKALDILNGRKAIMLLEIPLWIFLITSCKALFQYGQILSLQKLVLDIVQALQIKLFAALSSSDLEQLERLAPARRATYFTSDVFCVRDLISRLVNALGNMVTVIGLIISMLWMDWSLSLLALCLYPLAAWPLQQLGRHVRGHARDVQKDMGIVSEGLTESFAQAKNIRVYQMEKVEQNRISGFFASLRRAMMRVVRVKSTIEPFLEILGGLIVAAVFVFTSWRMQMGHESVGNLTGFVAALLLAAHPLRSLGNLHASLQEGCGSLERIYSILDLPRKVTSPAHPRDRNVRGRALCFENVSFTYGEGRWALEDLQFSVPQGAMVALVGVSGAGKSTALSLIPRFYDVGSGRITLGGVDIRHLSLAYLRGRIALVGQDTFLFSFSVKENIRVGRGNIGDNDIIAAAKAADIHDFIMSLPQGYDTAVGHAGMSLSGGQRQRIAIARALAGNMPILLFDEITSSLDSETESCIQKTLQKLKGKHSIIITAHRLSTVMRADEIIVFDQGHVSERGTHDELMKRQGAYARFVQSQYFHIGK